MLSRKLETPYVVSYREKLFFNGLLTAYFRLLRASRKRFARKRAVPRTHICRAIPGECPAPPSLSAHKCTHKCARVNARTKPTLSLTQRAAI